MTDSTVAATIARCFAAFNDYDTDRWARCYAEDAVFEDIALGRTWKGREDLADFMRTWLAACPDTHIELGEPIISGHRAAVPWRGGGTLEGSFEHLPDTAVRGSRIDKISRSLLREVWMFFQPAPEVQRAFANDLFFL